MQRHRKKANQKRVILGRGLFKEGPCIDLQANPITEYRFTRQESLEEHMTDVEDLSARPRARKRRRIQNKPAPCVPPVAGHTSSVPTPAILKSAESFVESHGDIQDLANMHTTAVGQGQNLQESVNYPNPLSLSNITSPHLSVPPTDSIVTPAVLITPPVEQNNAEATGDDMDDNDQLVDNEDDEEVIPSSRIPGILNWLKDNRMWVDLYYEHALPYKVMDAILRNIDAPCKSWKTVIANISRLSGIYEHLQTVPTCPGHFCYSAFDSDAQGETCSICGQPKPSEAFAGMGKVRYIPVLPRIAKMVSDPGQCKDLHCYWDDRVRSPGSYRDFFDGDAFLDLCEQYGEDELRYDIFIGVSTDGFQAFKNRSGDVWPIVAVLLNISPSHRYAVKNVLPLLFTEDERQPKDVQSFLKPLISEVQNSHESGGVTMTFADGIIRRVRLHVAWLSADLAALMKVAGLNGHNAKFPCRYCLVEGVFSGHYYFPSKLRDGASVETRYNLSMPIKRTVEETIQTFEQMATCTSRTERNVLSKNSGISNRSIVFDLPGIVPYRSFPVDVMHLFYNVQVQLLNLHLGTWFEDVFVLTQDEISVLDEELPRFSAGISGQMAPKPRLLSKFGQWKAAEHKEFSLSYMLILLDGFIPREYMNGLSYFVELVDLCFRPFLSYNDVIRVESLARRFVEYYEKSYMRYQTSRVNLCKYVIHLLLHLGESIRVNGPPICSSQYWVEKYIGWTVQRSNARILPGSAMSNSATFAESYKLFYNVPVSESDSVYESLLEQGGSEMAGCKKVSLSGSGVGSVQIRKLVADYLVRKFEGLTEMESKRAALSLRSIECAASLKFISGSTVQLARVSDSRRSDRPSCFIAAEMEHTEDETHVYYGTLRKLIRFEFESGSGISDNRIIGVTFSVGLIAWASNLKKGSQGQVYKPGPPERAFGASTIEDVSVIQRLIGVIQHNLPRARGGVASSSTAAQSLSRGMESRTYFIDHFMRSDGLLDAGEMCEDGVNRILKGLR